MWTFSRLRHLSTQLSTRLVENFYALAFLLPLVFARSYVFLPVLLSEKSTQITKVVDKPAHVIPMVDKFTPLPRYGGPLYSQAWRRIPLNAHCVPPYSSATLDRHPSKITSHTYPAPLGSGPYQARLQARLVDRVWAADEHRSDGCLRRRRTTMGCRHHARCRPV